MRTLKLLIALIVVATTAACGSPDGNNGSTLNTLLPPPTGEVQDAPPPSAATSTTVVASGGPVLPTTTTRFYDAPIPGGPSGGAVTATTGASSTPPAGGTTETTETTGTAPTTTTTGSSSTTKVTSTTTATSPTTTTTPPLRAQSITFAPLVGPWAYLEPRSIAATADSGLPLDYGATGACVVANALLGIVRASDVGECTITVSQKGDGTWKPATPVSRSITISKAAQVITGFVDTSREHPRVPFSIALTASASSGAPVGYQLVADYGSENFCTVTGAVLDVQITGGILPRTCTVEASVEESRLYEKATARARFTIDPTVVKFTGHSIIEQTDTSVTVSVSLNVAWRIDVVATSPISDPPIPCGTAPPEVLEGAATYKFTIALLAPVASANPCEITVTIYTVDAAHTSEELTIKLL